MENISPVQAIKDGWRLTKSHFVVTLGLLLGYTVLSMLMSFIPSTGFIGIVCQILSSLITIIWTYGIVKLTIEVVDGDEPRFGVFSEMMPRLLSLVLMEILMTVIVMLPFFVILGIGVVVSGVSFTANMLSNPEAMLLAFTSLGVWFLVALIPVIYMSLRFDFAPYIFVDRNAGVIESLKMSWEATAPIQGKVLMFMLLSLLMILAGLLCFFVGVIVAALVIIYAQAALYRQVFSPGIQDQLIVDNTNVVVG